MRVALVTGAATGIGAATADALEQQGLTVARNHLPGQTVPGYSAPADVSDAGAVNGMVARIGADLGPVSVLVCNAAYMVMGAVEDVGPEDFWRVLDTNLTGSFNCIRACAPGMTAARFGRIVNIASGWGVTGWPRASAYSASKAGVISLTKSLGKEVARTGIRVNCVTPAAVKTGMFNQMTQAHIDFMLSKIPMGRFGQVEEIASLVAWLCTEECSFSTGAVFDLSGGRAVY